MARRKIIKTRQATLSLGPYSARCPTCARRFAVRRFIDLIAPARPSSFSERPRTQRYHVVNSRLAGVAEELPVLQQVTYCFIQIRFRKSTKEHRQCLYSQLFTRDLTGFLH